MPALLALDGSGVTTDPVPGDGQWHAARLYLRTGTASTVDLAVSLGWFGNIVKGDADFDLLKLKKIAAAPPDAQVAELAAAAGAGGAATPRIVTPGPSKAVIPLTVALLILLVGCGRVLLKDKP